jgi:hypothetical protein
MSSLIFHDVTLDAAGNICSRRTHDSATLQPAAVEVFRDLFERHGEAFRVPLPVQGLEHIELSLTRSGTTALATFSVGGAPVTTSALVPGISAEDDREVLEQLQSLVVRFFGDSPIEPGFDLLSLSDRPLLVTVPLPLPLPPGPVRGIIAGAETCLAAAFFLSVIGGSIHPMIPRELAYRIWSDCLSGRAASLGSLSGEGAVRAARRRGGEEAAEGARRAIHARLAAAEDLDRAARTIGGWIGDKDRCRGADVPPELVAWVCAFIAGDTRAPAELARLCPGRTEGVAPRDFPALIERLLS